MNDTFDEKKLFSHLIHGGDYNPDQWLHRPEIFDEDFRLMPIAGCNTMSIGIFSWSRLEPHEGTYDFSWLDDIMDRLAKNGLRAVLATPSGARPVWLAQKYPEVLRVGADRRRNLYGFRHNHCLTSPVYREKTRAINRLLAQRYGSHPALLLWHVSNEYGGECHCELCQQAFREFLKEKYGNDLERLNQAWWTGFWSHRYSDWSQIESPSPLGDESVHGLNLDWKRFVTRQTIDFYRNEIAPLRELTPEVPVTTNFMGLYPGLDYAKFAQEVDVVSWDNYPAWHTTEKSDAELGAETAFIHDLNRSFKKRPFLMMESTPSAVNWQPINKIKRPGMHLLSSLQAVAHGSDSVQYFQWRSGRGGSEKFHGSVVGHSGHERTRVFGDVASVGDTLKKLDAVAGTGVSPEVALIYDWENRWAVEDAQMLNRSRLRYEETCKEHYLPFWKRGIPVDVICEEKDFSSYKLLIAPMLYMVKPGVAERMEAFVKNGGTLVLTYLSGLVDENDLCFMGGFPGPLRRVAGIWAEEMDALYDGEENSVVPAPGLVGFAQSYRAFGLCDLIHAETADVLGVYGSDFYKGRPALTRNSFGSGSAYYIAARTGTDLLDDLYGSLIDQVKPLRAIDAELPQGVTAQLRTDAENRYVFLMNFGRSDACVELPAPYYEMLSGSVTEKAQLTGYGVKVLKIPCQK